jgi:hypothetical protein
MRRKRQRALPMLARSVMSLDERNDGFETRSRTYSSQHYHEVKLNAGTTE